LLIGVAMVLAGGVAAKDARAAESNGEIILVAFPFCPRDTEPVEMAPPVPGLRHCLVTGIYSPDHPYLGSLQRVAFSWCPRDSLPADGRLLPIPQNDALYALLGAKFGGDGRVNFALPRLASDLRYCVVTQGIFPGRPDPVVQRMVGFPRFAALAGYKVCDPKAVAMLTRGPLELRDLKHDKALVASDVPNNKLYHQDRQGRQNGLFNFKSVENCAFEITDTKHNLALVAGDVYNGHVSHELPKGRANARWELWRVEGAGKVWGYVLMDQKHRQNLIAGDAYDGNVYEQPWSGRANGLWRLFSSDGNPLSLP
jgi:hypothetical protein